MTIKEKAFAKINLYLDVIGKREDGFHELETIMQTVDLADEVEIEKTENAPSVEEMCSNNSKRDLSHKTTLKISGNDNLPADESNLVIRAARAFDKVRPVGNIEITLKKRIPTEAGLGGGSADAAATLRALNKMTENPLSQKELLDIAENLGADVPFCLVGGRALCYGKGEKIYPLENTDQLCILIAKTDEMVSTPKAYAMLDNLYNNFESIRKNDGRKEILSALKSNEYNNLYNIFEEPTLDTCPQAKFIKERMLSLGAKSTLMSGSGPSVFGIFDSLKTAKKAKNVIETENQKALVFITKTV